MNDFRQFLEIMVLAIAVIRISSHIGFARRQAMMAKRPAVRGERVGEPK